MTENGRLFGKVAIVTGGGRGIGLSLVRKLAREGARIVINDLDEAPAMAAMQEAVERGAEAICVPGSVTDNDFPNRIVNAAFDQFGDVHMLINNAGYIWNNSVSRMSDEQWDAMQDVHLKAPFRILRALHRPLHERVQHEQKQGIRVHRKVVNVASMAATRGAIGLAAYAAAKAGLIGLTRSVAKEWGKLNVNVNCVAFGLIETRLTQETESEMSVQIAGQARRVGLPASNRQMITENTALGRAGTAEEAAGGIMLFCLPESDYVTGQCLEVTGGFA